MFDLFQHFQTADWIAVVGVLATLIGILATALVAYHVAVRQGVFRKPILLASFGPMEDVPPAFVLLNLTNLPRPNNIIALHYALVNNGTAPITNVTVQFNVTPKGPEQLPWKYDRDVEISSIGDRDVVIFRYASLAPDQGEVLSVPFFIRGNALPAYGLQLGRVDVYITYDQGSRIEQHVEIAAIVEPDFPKVFANQQDQIAARLTQLTDRLAQPNAPVRVLGWKATLSAFFNAPFLTTSWIALDITLKPINDSVALDRVAADKLEPGMYPATMHFGFNLRGRLRFLFEFLLFLLAPLVLYLLARTFGYIH